MLTEYMQRRAVWELVYGKPERTPAVEQFEEPWRTLYLVAERHLEQGKSASDALGQAAQAAASGERDYWAEVSRLLEAVSSASDAPRYDSYEDIAATLPPIAWLWDNWLPRGMLSLLGGFQGTGKSYLALDLARIVTQAETWPDGTPVQAPGRPAVYVEAEAVPQITAQRLRDMGMRADRLYPLLPDRYGIINLTERSWQDRLADMVGVLKPELVIIDSLSTISDRSQNDVEALNDLLMFLVRLAAFGNCGMLVLHHLRKPSAMQLSLPGVSIHDFRGSGHITAMARTVLGYSVVQTGKQFSLNGPRRLDLAKTNVGDYPTPIGIKLVKDPAGRTLFEYGQAAEVESGTQRDAAAEWLLDALELAGEPLSQAEIVKQGLEEEYSRPTVLRALDALEQAGQIVPTKGRKVTGNKWALATWDLKGDT